MVRMRSSPRFALAIGMRWNYLKQFALPYEAGLTWEISARSGSLLKRRSPLGQTDAMPAKVAECLRYCMNPYLCAPTPTANESASSTPDELSRLRRMYRTLDGIGSGRFHLSRLYASIHHSVFSSTNNCLISLSFSLGETARHHCFQRALVAAKSSASFLQTGTLFVGAFLPTVEMHAWIIDDGMQPDPLDREWIHFRPLLALYCE